jgi:hypothetical protein
MRQWVAGNYPGTKLSISEYNWGGLESVNGALTQADVLGIFGREALDRALLWSPPTSDQPGAFAFRIFRNYNGSGAHFGETSVKATSSDQAQLAVYAAQRTADNAVTAVVINKTPGDLTSGLALTGSSASGAQVYTYSGADATHIVRGPDAVVSGSSLTRTYPANSITLLVLQQSVASAQPTSLTVSAAPTSATYGDAVSIGGKLAAGSSGVSGQAVVLEAMRAGTTTWQTIGTSTTGATGVVQRSVKPTWTGSWRWRYAGSADYQASSSPGVAVTVRELVTSGVSKTSVPRGQPVSFYGKIYPAHSGAAVYLQVREGTASWRKIGQATPAANGAYTLAYRPLASHYYRIYWPGDVDHAASAGPVLHVTTT